MQFIAASITTSTMSTEAIAVRMNFFLSFANMV